MKKLITTNLVITIVLIFMMILGEVFADLYMAAPLYSESEALYASLYNITNIVSGGGIIVMFIINVSLFFRRKEIF